MKAHQAVYRVATMCRVLDVSTSGYYAWLKREPSRRAREDEALTGRIKQIHRWSRGTYGVPRMHAELKAQGIQVGPKRVAKLMRRNELAGISRRKTTRTTIRGERQRPAPDLVNREFSASRPDRLWVADITYVPTWAGLLYLAWYWTPSAAGWWAGPWRGTCEQSSCWAPWTWL